MYGHATGVRAEWDVRQPVDISHAAVGHQTHASGRKQGLAHSVTEHAFVIGPGPNCLDDPDDGLLDLTDLFQLAPKRFHVRYAARTAAVQFAGCRDPNGRPQRRGNGANGVAQVVFVRCGRINIANRIS